LLAASISDKERIQYNFDKVFADKELEIIFDQFREEYTKEEINRITGLTE